MSVALHAVFDAPRDRIVWDVGHQGYPHKFLTGRGDRLETLRQENGLSGFLKRTESEYDTFGAGHAGTAISAGYGMAVARDLNGESYKVVSILGDGALTCGLAYEGLNNAGASERDFIVILNDNEMSIAPNVGAISKYLTSIQRNPLYNRVRSAIGSVVNLASRLSDEAQSGQILIDRRTCAALGDAAEVEPLGKLPLKGFAQPVPAFLLKRLAS